MPLSTRILLGVLVLVGAIMLVAVTQVDQQVAGPPFAGTWRGEGEGWPVELRLRRDRSFVVVRRFTPGLPWEEMLAGRFEPRDDRLLLRVDRQAPDATRETPYTLRVEAVLGEARHGYREWTIELENPGGPRPHRMRFQRDARSDD